VGFLEDLMLLVIKRFLSMKIVDSICSKSYSMGYPHVIFPSMKAFVENIIFSLVEKTMILYVQP
jgi:hypothetical protein